MSVLHLVPNKDDVLFKAHQLLKQGGVFVSSTVCLRDFAGYLRWVVPAVSWLGVIPKVSFFTKDELRQSIEAQSHSTVFLLGLFKLLASSILVSVG